MLEEYFLENHLGLTFMMKGFLVSLYFSSNFQNSEFIAKSHIFRDLSPYRPFQELTIKQKQLTLSSQDTLTFQNLSSSTIWFFKKKYSLEIELSLGEVVCNMSPNIDSYTKKLEGYLHTPDPKLRCAISPFLTA